MGTIRISPKANNDLLNMWLYSFEQWGEAQAEHYYELVTTGIHNLSNNPNLGRSCDFVSPGYRSLLVERHVIYYKINNQCIDIVRILHERMSPIIHL